MKTQQVVREKLPLTIETVQEYFIGHQMYYEKQLAKKLEEFCKKPSYELGWMGEDLIQLDLNVMFFTNMNNVKSPSMFVMALQNQVEEMTTTLLNYYPARSTNPLMNFTQEIKMEFYSRTIRELKKILKDLNS